MADGILQSIDVEVNLSGGQIEFPDESSVTNLNVKRKFGGGGSKAKVEVIFEDALSDDQISGLRRSVRAATQQPRFDNIENFQEGETNELENEATTATFDDLASAIESDEMSPENIDGVSSSDIGEPNSDPQSAAIDDGRIVAETVRTTSDVTNYRTLKAWIDSLDEQATVQETRRRVAQGVLDFTPENEGNANDPDYTTRQEELRDLRADQIDGKLADENDAYTEDVLTVDQLLISKSEAESIKDDLEDENDLTIEEQNQLILANAILDGETSNSLGPAVASRLEGVDPDDPLGDIDLLMDEERAQAIVDGELNTSSPLVRDANYEDAQFLTKSEFDEATSLTDKAQTGLVTVEQLRTVRAVAESYLEQKQEEFENRQEFIEDFSQPQEPNLTPPFIPNDVGDNPTGPTGGTPVWAQDIEQNDTGGESGNELLDEDELFLGDPILIEIDVVVTEIEAGSVQQRNHRVFTGTVTKVLETNEKVIKFHALDARYQLNNFVVSMSVNGSDGDPVPRQQVVDQILGGGALIAEDGGNINASVGGDRITPIEGGNESGAAGIEEPNDPAADITLEDILSGIDPNAEVTYDGEVEADARFPSADERSISLTYQELIRLDEIDESVHGDQNRHLRRVIEITDIQNAVEFSEISDKQVGRIAEKSRAIRTVDQIDTADVLNVRDHIAGIVTQIRGGDGVYQEKVNTYEQRLNNDSDGESGEKDIANYAIGFEDESPLTRTREWGMDYYETAYDVIQELAFETDAMLHIDEYNTIHFDHRAGIEESDLTVTNWSSSTSENTKKLPPVLEWDGGDEKSDEDVIVESKLGSNALGVFGPTAATEVPQDVKNASEGLRNMSVSSVTEVRQSRVSKILDRDMMLDSGTLKLAGDPRINSWDNVTLDDEIVDGFATVSQGTYKVKEVRHKVTPQDGYITEVDLGKDPQRLLRDFAFQETSEEAEQQQEELEEARSNNQSGDGEGAIDEALDAGGELLDGDFGQAAKEVGDAIDEALDLDIL